MGKEILVEKLQEEFLSNLKSEIKEIIEIIIWNWNLNYIAIFAYKLSEKN